MCTFSGKGLEFRVKVLPYFEGSWLVVSGVISRITIAITQIWGMNLQVGHMYLGAFRVSGILGLP